jgi:hypothetical protein
MTRVQSVFNLLKRVGFAVLLLGYAVGYCAWDTDPQNPTFLWDTSTDPTIVADGLGGAFFAFSILGSYWPHIGHVNAHGDQTYPIGTLPYENLLPVDEPQYAGTPIGTTLVRSGPPGTVVAVHERGLNGQYGGFVFSQFNTSGSSGFASVKYVGQEYRLLSLQADDDHGWATIAGDLDGGVHFVMRGPQIDGQFTKYYNHLNSNGQFTHEWPGLLLPRVQNWSAYVFEDGFGGAFFVQSRAAAMGDSLIGQHFDSDGQATWEPNGRLLSTSLADIWGQYDLMSPGKLIFWGREEVEEDSFAHYGYCIDTSGAMIWGEDGITFECNGSEIIHLAPDQLGGFFYHSFINGYGYGCRYDENGNLTATALQTFAARYFDQLGGAFNYHFIDEIAPLDSVRITFDRFNTDLTPVWDFAPYVIDFPTSLWGRVAIPDGFGGLIGLVSTGRGMAFYHLNLDGSVGPNLSAQEREGNLPNELRLSTFPNPFNSTLAISLETPLHQEISLTLYDLLGREVGVIYRGRLTTNTLSYSPRADLASGVYFLRAATKTQSQIQKVTLLK